MRIYLSGPMSGIAESNYPAFNRAARLLEEMEKAGIGSAMYSDGQRDVLRAEEAA